MDSTAFLFGIDALLASDPSWKTHRIGLLTNDAARTQNGEKSRVALLKQNYQLVRLFSPEHGMKAQGKDGAWMSHQIDEITKLPIVSLYQEQQQVNDENIDDLDVLMVDLPDVGVRFYTYLWSMTYFIEAAARKKRKLSFLTVQIRWEEQSIKAKGLCCPTTAQVSLDDLISQLRIIAP